MLMLIKLEPRSVPSRNWQILSPVVALLATVIVGIFLFTLLGKSPIIALKTLFISPLSSFYGITELAVKAAPILLIAVGLAVCFQGKVWNIGAEGQFTIWAIFSSIVALNLHFLML
jgi:general nucleoside transport system permease protein